MVSQALGLKSSPHLLADDTQEARMVSQALRLKSSHHLQADDTQRGQNGEPGFAVEITTPPTS